MRLTVFPARTVISLNSLKNSKNSKIFPWKQQKTHSKLDQIMQNDSGLFSDRYFEPPDSTVTQITQMGTKSLNSLKIQRNSKKFLKFTQ